MPSLDTFFSSIRAVLQGEKKTLKKSKHRHALKKHIKKKKKKKGWVFFIKRLKKKKKAKTNREKRKGFLKAKNKKPFRALKKISIPKKSLRIKKAHQHLKKKQRPLGVKASRGGRLLSKEKSAKEVYVGEITHFFSRIQVVVIKIIKGKLAVGASIHIVGKKTDFFQKIKSLQVESLDVKLAKKGQLVGLKVDQAAKERDKVFLIK